MTNITEEFVYWNGNTGRTVGRENRSTNDQANPKKNNSRTGDPNFYRLASKSDMNLNGDVILGSTYHLQLTNSL